MYDIPNDRDLRAMIAHPGFSTRCMQLIDIARLACEEIILPAFRSPDLKISQKSGAQDLVTEADIAAERQMSAQIAAIFPDAVIIGEESVAQNPALINDLDDIDTCIIIDPIDGTSNYAHGIATFGVAIAVLVRGVTIFGTLYDPIMDDAAYAFYTRGARWLSKQRQSLSIKVHSGQIGFVPLTSMPSANAGKAIDFGHTMSPIKSLNCSAHEYRLLCQGVASWAVATKSASWDHAAGALIHTEAGGITRFADGEAYRASRNTGAIISAPDEEAWAYLKEGFAPLL